MNELKLRTYRKQDIKLGDVVTLCAREKFAKGRTGWGTVIEVIERGIAGTVYLCGIRWFNRPPHSKGSVSYHYDRDLMLVEEKLQFDNHIYNSVDDIPRNK
jgi:hypothetical protein